MKKSIFQNCFFVFVSMLFILSTFSISNAGGKKIKWRMTSAWPPSIEHIHIDKNFVRLVNELSDGELEITFFDGGTLVPAFQVFDAVEKGTVEASGDCPCYSAGKNSAFTPLCSMPMGLSAIDYMVWIYKGGGFELYQEIYGKYGLVFLPFDASPMESGVRSNKPIESLEDYKGLKIRMGGQIQGMVLKDLGASHTMISGGECYQALEKGVIDAVEFSTPSVDWGMGLGEVTKFWSAPAWYSPTVLIGVEINKNAWDNLPDRLKTLLKTAAMANFVYGFTRLEYGSIEATQKFLDKGIKITRLSDEDLAKLQNLTNSHILEQCKKNPLFAKVIYSQEKFLKDIAQWRSISTPFTYGRNPDLMDLDKIKAYIK